MRASYKNPKELESKLRDLVDTYLEGLLDYEELEQTVAAIINANGDRVYKNGFIPTRLSTALGYERTDIIAKIAETTKQLNM
ncbi:TIGR04540 family protein [Clostridium thailandense]|uniref:TIGR04540 family protein n=1 Tax=Clostridium thailandense TaxID=2794346 RepID=A0A949TQ83_9CLOT|nr:TIGR04540 family protein [Clostridium thailandense]MBV7276540.1 TIGR04540 family protein [Clostridium thailandense]